MENLEQRDILTDKEMHSIPNKWHKHPGKGVDIGQIDTCPETSKNDQIYLYLGKYHLTKSSYIPIKLFNKLRFKLDMTNNIYKHKCCLSMSELYK